MAISSKIWPLFSDLLKFVQREAGPTRPRPRVLCLGYIDFLITNAEVVQAFGPEVAEAVSMRTDSASIAKWHRSTSSVVDALSLFTAAGFEVDFIDVQASRGIEIICDLNELLPERFHDSYDLVIDSGTLEHCFNVGQAIKNAALALRPGGIIYHLNPLLMINHGFYNFSPTFYYDFYTSNGFEILHLASLETDSQSISVDALHPTHRLTLTSTKERVVEAIARKLRNGPIVWPTQTKYKLNSQLRAK